MTVSGGSDGEFRVAIALLGASGVALVMALRAICDLLQGRERKTGRQMTDDELDALLTLAKAIPGQERRLARIERSLPAIQEALDEILRRETGRRATDGS
jgi:hypothetical protein